MDAALFSAFGETSLAVYTDLSGNQTSVHLILGMERVEHDYDESGKKQLKTRQATISRSEIADVSVGATLAAGGVTYSIVRIDRQDVSVTTVEMTRTDDKAKHESNRARR
jgi:riboflavin synthase alpha subunit